jgi:hypothetical protein
MVQFLPFLATLVSSCKALSLPDMSEIPFFLTRRTRTHSVVDLTFPVSVKE